ncbi:glycosyltransferase [Qipengyuania gaetbuli]|uniref:glycosyltransferase n=1 Tax=Qipengyuania gaetbuli TaxID=266952 RepID=UPI001CD81263|nr:glycosyltransferase [Qipengyuania gaetbuli]MCA0911027.1 glycosyltransferase [Qipengyuania gaetbuli]
MPLVSIIMPAYNHAPYVREALQSVASQTYPNIELIVIDDGSADSTPQIIGETLAEFEREMRIEYHKQKNVGVCATLNRALSLARGEFVQFIASDDVYLSEMTARTVEALRRASPEVAAVYSDGYIIDEKSRRRAVFSDIYPVPISKNVRRELFIANWIPAMGILYRRRALVELNGFDPDLKFEDWDLLLRLTQRNQVERIPEKLFLYRVHSTNMTRDTAIMMETTDALARKHADLAKFKHFKQEIRRNPAAAILRNPSQIDLLLRLASRRLLTNRGIQGESLAAGALTLLKLIAGRAASTTRAGLYRLAGLRLGRRSKVRGRLTLQGNKRNLVIGEGVIFEGDAEFILPRGRGQGRVEIGDNSVIAHGAHFHCLAGTLLVGPSCYVGRNSVLQSNGDLEIGAWTMIAALAGVYASNHVTSSDRQPFWRQGNKFSGIIIGENCWISHGAVVADGANLGDGSIIGPNVVVRGTHAPKSRIIS